MGGNQKIVVLEKNESHLIDGHKTQSSTMSKRPGLTFPLGSPITPPLA